MSVKAKTVEAVGAVTETASRNFEQTVSTIKKGAAEATYGMEQAHTKMKENMDKAVKAAEQMASFSQGNFEAVVKSSQIWASGMQDLSKQMAAHTQAMIEETLSAFKAMSSVKSVKEAIDLQTGLARTAFEKTISENSHLTEQSLKLAEQAFAPISARLTAAVETFSSHS